MSTGLLLSMQGAAIARESQATFDRLFQPLVEAGEVFFLRFPAHFFIIPHKQAPRRVQSEERHGVKALFTQLRPENAVVSQRVAIDFARHFLRQPAARRFVVAEIHLLVALVAVERPAKRFSRREFFLPSISANGSGGC